MAEMRGIAHIQLCVSDMAKSPPFYSKLPGAMDMTPVMADKSFYKIACELSAPIIRKPEESNYAPLHS
jgi:hypothetical protein